MSGRFWKMLGASTEKDHDRSMDKVRAAEEFAAKAADLGDEQMRKATLDHLAHSETARRDLAENYIGLPF